MVEIIGLVTIGALVWLLAWAMAGECDAERRRTSSGVGGTQSGTDARSVMPKSRAA
jgi:hypothetical protein